MAKDKSKDIRLLKITCKVTDTRSVTMAYVLYELDVIRSNSEVTINSILTPIVKNEPDGEPLLDDYVASGPASQTNMFKKDNKLTCNVDLISKVIRFPHLNRYKISKNYRGYGLSSYALNEIANIIKDQYPDYEIEPIHFSFTQENEDIDRGAFFAFMEKFGFWFSFDGEDNNKGILNVERAEMIKLATKKDTIVELEIATFIKSLFDDRTKQHAEITRIRTEFKDKNTVFNRFEKDQAITFLMNIIGALILLIMIILFL
ncbi:MAG: hypothetical protein C0603_05080 [Denitrovibrio sp.]|nr:MAG: hypothetical protein C0603_05080 [Denitrovibrio sp.]